MKKFNYLDDEAMIGKNISHNLKRYRKLYSLSQGDVANYLNISRSAYSNYENGYRLLDIFNLYKLGRLYKVPVDTFCKEPKGDEVKKKIN